MIWRAYAVESRPGDKRRASDPAAMHDYLPSRKPDDDTCSICGRDWDAPLHTPIGPDEPEVA